MVDIASIVSGFNLTSFLGLLGPILLFGFFIVFIVGVGAIIWYFGLLTPRPYDVLVLSERGNGIKPFMKRGRNLASGLFEIWFGPMGKAANVQAPLEKMIAEGTVIFFRRAVDDYIPCILRLGTAKDTYLVDKRDEKGKLVKDQKGNVVREEKLIGEVLLDPCMNPAAKLAFAKQTTDDARRFSRPGFIEKYGLMIVFVICAIVLGASFLFSAGMISNTGAQCNANSNVIAQKFAGAQNIIIEVSPNTTTSGQPLPGLPHVTPGG